MAWLVAHSAQYFCGELGVLGSVRWVVQVVVEICGVVGELGEQQAVWQFGEVHRWLLVGCAAGWLARFSVVSLLLLTIANHFGVLNSFIVLIFQKKIIIRRSRTRYLRNDDDDLY